MLSREATNTNLIVFGLMWSGLEHTIYRTRDEHANPYTTDEVINNGKLNKCNIKSKCGHYFDRHSRVRARGMEFNATFNNISFKSLLWRSVLLVVETRVPGENHRPATVICRTPCIIDIWLVLLFQVLNIHSIYVKFLISAPFRTFLK